MTTRLIGAPDLGERLRLEVVGRDRLRAGQPQVLLVGRERIPARGRWRAHVPVPDTIEVLRARSILGRGLQRLRNLLAGAEVDDDTLRRIADAETDRIS